jgi:hypothetical protein
VPPDPDFKPPESKLEPSEAEKLREEYQVQRRLRREEPPERDGCGTMVVDGAFGTALVATASAYYYTDGDPARLLVIPFGFWLPMLIPCTMLGYPIGMALGIFVRMAWRAMRGHSKKL